MRAVEPKRTFGRRAFASRALVGRASASAGRGRAGATVRIARVRASARGAEARASGDDDDEAKRRRRREGLAEGVMAIMLGKKMGDRGAEETTSTVPAARRFGVKAAVGACVLAAAGAASGDLLGIALSARQRALAAAGAANGDSDARMCPSRRAGCPDLRNRLAKTTTPSIYLAG